MSLQQVYSGNKATQYHIYVPLIQAYLEDLLTEPSFCLNAQPVRMFSFRSQSSQEMLY